SLTWPSSAGSIGQVLTTDGAGTLSWSSAAVGSVTNVGLEGDAIFDISGSSISSAGTFNIGLTDQNANLILASPNGSSGAPTFRALVAADIPSLDADKITSGTFATARLGMIPASIVDGTLATAQIGDIDASQITSGTLATARIGELDASAIATGTFATARLGNIPASLIDGTLATAQIGNIDASQITTGTLATARIGNLPASAITTGTMATARLGMIPTSSIDGTLSQWDDVNE